MSTVIVLVTVPDTSNAVDSWTVELVEITKFLKVKLSVTVPTNSNKRVLVSYD